MIKKWVAFFILLFLFPYIVNADLKKVISIASDNLDYLFFVIAGAVIDEQNNVFVCDSRGSFIRKYDWQGRFIKEIGKYGQGPGDFSNAISGLFLNRDLYLLDNGNNRIVEIDRELNIKRYIKIERPAQKILKYGDRFYMVSRKGDQSFFEIGIYDRDGNPLEYFFDRHPGYLEKVESSKIGFVISLIYSTIATAMDRETGEIAVTFQWPGESIEIFIYSKEGQFTKKITVDHLIKYNFPEFRLKGLPSVLKFPGRSNLIMLRSIHYLTPSRLLLEYWVSEFELDKVAEEKEYILIIDKNTGKVVHKEALTTKIGILDVRGNYVCGVLAEAEVPQITVYRLSY